MATLALACLTLAGMSSASLVSTSFGFPVIVQSGNTSAFNQDTAFATDFENVNIDFPIFSDGTSLGATVGDVALDGVAVSGSSNVLPFGPVNLAFPSISQTVQQTQEVTHTDFAQTNEFAEFSYPFESVGTTALPGFGFGF
jgi:C4-dicarboxylate transporter